MLSSGNHVSSIGIINNNENEEEKKEGSDNGRGY
jgi:hypothetical protein